MSQTFGTDLLDRYLTLPSWLIPLWDQPNTRYAIILLIAAGVFALLTQSLGKKPGQTQTKTNQAEPDVNRPTNTGVFRRIWWRIHPPTDLMRIDGLVIDRTRKPHCAWLGPTGSGKSASVATIRVDGKRPTLIATPDISDPLREATLRLGGVIWTACESTTPINFLIGTPTEVAERLTKVFRSGGQGVWLRAARRATAAVIRMLDDADEPRTLHAIGTALALAVKSDRELKTACAMWVERFLDIADQLGDSIGPDGLDVADLLRQGKTVLLDNDAFNHLALGGDIVAFALAEAQRCASLVPGGYRIIFEEAGQLGERIDLAEPFHRAGRRRKITVDDLTQAESDLNEGISANIATRVYFAQELKSLQKVAADRLGLPYTDLDPANMRDFTAYIAHGKIRRLVHFPRPPRPTRSSSYANPTEYEPTHLKPETPTARRIIIEEVRAGEDRLPSLPPPRLEVQALLDQIDRSGHCHVWMGTQDRDGYGIVRWNGNWARVHRVVWELACGPIPLGENGRPLDLDHQCRNRLCSKIDHLEPISRSLNVKRMWAYRGKKGRAAI